MFVIHQILILQWFLKDRVTPKTDHRNKLHFTVYSHRKQLIYIRIIFHCFYCIFWSNKCRLD